MTEVMKMVDVNPNSLGNVQVTPDRTQQRDRAQSAQVDVTPQPQPQAAAEVDVTVELSNVVNNLQKVREAVDEEPVVRDERIDRIRQQIANGELKVNAQNIALQLILE